ncbi:hypothetical protein HRbin02_01970 [Candidatus Calditenuaceae archaeon HR02]|nr:hypothetical protein HRbin02_01970 [Candidatus Calditenuaceae archaeon HR02]
MVLFRDRSRLSPSYLPPHLRYRGEELSRQKQDYGLFSFDEIDYYVRRYGADVGTRITEVIGGDVNVVVVTARSRDYEKLLDPG